MSAAGVRGLRATYHRVLDRVELMLPEKLRPLYNHPAGNGSRRDLASGARGHLRRRRRHLHPRVTRLLSRLPCCSLCLVHHLSPALTTCVAPPPLGATPTRSGFWAGACLPHSHGPRAPWPRRVWRERSHLVRLAQPSFGVCHSPARGSSLSPSFVKCLGEPPLHRFCVDTPGLHPDVPLTAGVTLGETLDLVVFVKWSR